MLPNAFRSFKAPRSKSIRPSGTIERRCRRLKQLLAEAERALAGLAEQLEPNREAAAQLSRQAEAASDKASREDALAKKQSADQSVAELQDAYARQQEQVGDLGLQLGKAEATLARLRSQRDLLEARLKIAQARRGRVPLSPWRRLLRSKIASATVAAAAVLILAGALVFWLRRSAVSTNSIGMTLVLVPAGEFDMGSTPDEILQYMEESRPQDARGGNSKLAIATVSQPSEAVSPQGAPAWYLERLRARRFAITSR